MTPLEDDDGCGGNGDAIALDANATNNAMHQQLRLDRWAGVRDSLWRLVEPHCFDGATKHCTNPSQKKEAALVGAASFFSEDRGDPFRITLHGDAKSHARTDLSPAPSDASRGSGVR